jgi:hypothetical protein
MCDIGTQVAWDCCGSQTNGVKMDRKTYMRRQKINTKFWLWNLLGSANFKTASRWESNIKMYFSEVRRLWICELDGNVSESCTIVGFDSSGVEPSMFTASGLINN